jgi:hypothetical protein
MLVALALIPAFSVLPQPVKAQTFSQRPDGIILYQTDLTTTGIFTCGMAVITSGSCMVSGNTLLLGGQGGTLRLGFEGRSGPIIASNVRAFFNPGTLTTDFEGGGTFLFPTLLSVSPLFRLAITYSSTLQNAAVTAFQDFFSDGSSQIRSECCFGGSVASLRITPQQPYPFGYGAVSYSDFSTINLAGRDERILLQASVGLIPEPGTMALTATGLIGLLGFARRRRVRLGASRSQ